MVHAPRFNAVVTFVLYERKFCLFYTGQPASHFPHLGLSEYHTRNEQFTQSASERDLGYRRVSATNTQFNGCHFAGLPKLFGPAPNKSLQIELSGLRVLSQLFRLLLNPDRTSFCLRPMATLAFAGAIVGTEDDNASGVAQRVRHFV